MDSAPPGSSILWLVTKLASRGKIKLRWSIAKVEVLKTRPVQCYKCWAFGHLKSSCQSTVDRSNACFKCDVTGHPAKLCPNAVQCVVCKDADQDFNHRLGSAQCYAVKNQVKLVWEETGNNTSGRRTDSNNMDVV